MAAPRSASTMLGPCLRARTVRHGRRSDGGRLCLASSRLRRQQSSASFSTTARRASSATYDATIPNLKIGAGTRVIYQGFTGRVSTSNAQQSLEWGTKVVGGTTPGKEGEHLGLPLLPSVRAAAEQLKPDASAVFVAAHQAARAIEDAIEAEIPLIVAVAEFIPLHDVLRLSEILNTQSKSRLVGANSPGIIAPLGRCRIGFQPLPCYLEGHVGVIAKSGTLSYEAVGSLTRAGVGQSLCIGMGGDIVAGTNMVESLALFEKDNDTQGIVIIGEVGGRAEQDAAEWIKDYRKRVKDPKPIAAVVGGVRAVPSRIMGHAGAFASLGEDTADVKAKALADAGAEVVDHPSQFGGVMKKLLEQSGRGKFLSAAQSSSGAGAQQARGLHTLARRSYHTTAQRRPALALISPTQNRSQRRGLHYSDEQSKKLLKDHSIPVADSTSEAPQAQRTLAIKVDRSSRLPAIVASPTADPKHAFARAKLFPYQLSKGPSNETVKEVMQALQMSSAPPEAASGVAKIIRALVTIFKENEAYALLTQLSTSEKDGSIVVHNAAFSFDNSALKSGKRQQEIHAARRTELEDADELSVEGEGIVYIKLDDASANIGTLINGAGLAMNANDALTLRGARPTNFLDTGGKATKETVKRCFEVLLRDERVKVIFVNIFGGITLCDMIAEGIMLAFRDLDMKIPVVVRLRGTNEELGQKMISESGLPLHAFDDFSEAAAKCIELAKGGA